MRNQWRLLLHARRISTSTQVHHSLRSFSSSSSTPSLLQAPSRPPHAPPLTTPTPFAFRCFSSSELAGDQNPPTDPPIDQTVALTATFSEANKTSDEIKLDLESKNVVITNDVINKALKSLESSPEVAMRLFDWVLENDSEKLSSKSYNLMAKVLGVNGLANEFWGMIGRMKRKGYGLRKGTFDRIFEKFEKDGLSDDLQRLKGVFAMGSTDNSVGNLCSRVCRVIRQDVWGDEVEKKLKELNVEYLSDLVAMVVENIGVEQNKGLIFFRWVEESGLCKHDACTFNAMVRVLGREDSSEKFWKVVDEMKNAGYELEEETYIDVLQNFVKKRMMKDAVDFYEFAMGGKNKPSVTDCTFLLKKIVVSKELDMDLFSKVVRVFTESGNVLTDGTLKAVLKSLMSVERVSECNKILKAMQASDFQPSSPMQSRVAYQLGKAKKSDEAGEFMENIELCGGSSSERAWASLIQGYCKAGDVTKASESFLKMVEKGEVSCAGYALDLLVQACCRENKAEDALIFVYQVTNQCKVRAEHSTYKSLIVKLLAIRRFVDALDVIALMKNQGYPPFLDPFIKYLSKKGTADEAITFMKAMTVKGYPSDSVFMRVFEAYFEAGRLSEAQDFLSKCPGYIKNHADVLNLFCSAKSGDTATAPAVAA